MRRGKKRGTAIFGWIVSALILIILFRAINHPVRVGNSGNLSARGTGSVEPETSAPMTDDGDLLARYAPDPDFIDQASFQAVKDHPSVFLVDIRTLREWNGGRIPGAVLIPLHELGERLDEVPRYQSVILYCRTANRTRQGLRLLRNAGFTSVRHLRGGIQAWDGPIETD